VAGHRGGQLRLWPVVPGDSARHHCVRRPFGVAAVSSSVYCLATSIRWFPFSSRKDRQQKLDRCAELLKVVLRHLPGGLRYCFGPLIARNVGGCEWEGGTKLYPGINISFIKTYIARAYAA